MVSNVQSMYYGQSGSHSGVKTMVGLTLTGGLIGMTMFHRPVKKDEFVRKAFESVRNKNFEKIASLEEAAKEISENKLSTEGKMLLESFGLAEDIPAITAKCKELEKNVTDKFSVKTLKDGFADTFDACGKNTHKMDSVSADAFRAVKRIHMWWGVGIGAGIGLALGLLTSRNS